MTDATAIVMMWLNRVSPTFAEDSPADPVAVNPFDVTRVDPPGSYHDSWNGPLAWGALVYMRGEVVHRIRQLTRASGPSKYAEVRQAIDTVEDSRRTHVEWVEYLELWGDDLRPMEEITGDRVHHQEAISRYDQVLTVLRRLA